MSEAKPAPSPWTAEHYDQDGRVDSMVVDANKQPVVWVGHYSKSKNDADAHLIAAAPELLEACKLAHNYLNSMYSTGHSLGEVEIALERAAMKADGRH